MATTRYHEAQRIALAEKLLAEKIADMMAKATADIELRYHLSVEQLLVKFQSADSRGPEPRFHCVIVSAKVPPDEDGPVTGITQA